MWRHERLASSPIRSYGAGSCASVFRSELLEREAFQLHCVLSRERWEDCEALVSRLYSARGYTVRRASPKIGALNVTLLACDGDSLFGTLTVHVGCDSQLAADELYAAEIQAFRARDASVAEVTRLAIDPSRGTKQLLGALFHAAYVMGTRLHSVTDVFIEVHPRHTEFYRRMLDFTPIGECRICPRVNAPAVLMHVETAHIAAQIAAYGGRPGATQSLYGYFCSAAEEETMKMRAVEAQRRMAEMDGEAPTSRAGLNTAAARPLAWRLPPVQTGARLSVFAQQPIERWS